MTLPVKWFHSGLTGAPAISDALGAITGILDACLVNGFNAHGVDALTYDSVTGKCTATINGGHGYADHQVVLIDGANEAEYNGEVRVTAVDALQFTYIPITAPSAATATGTISAKAAPVGGWEIAFTDTNRRVYRSTHPDSSGIFLRVDDSVDDLQAWVSAYESMTDIDTGANQFASGFWKKRSWTTSDTWAVVGDALGFYFSNRKDGAAAADHKGVVFFGDIVQFDSSDIYCAALWAHSDSIRYAGGNRADAFNYDSGLGVRKIFRDVAGAYGKNIMAYGISKLTSYPDITVSTLLAISGIPVYEVDGNTWRGRMPGAYSVLVPAPDSTIDENLMILLGADGNYVGIDIREWRQ